MTNEALAQRLPDGVSVDEFRKVISEAQERIALAFDVSKFLIGMLLRTEDGALDVKAANQALYDTCKRLLADPPHTAT